MRIRAGQKHADPFGSGSETLLKIFYICPKLCFLIHEYACLRPEMSAICEKLAKNTNGRTAPRSFISLIMLFLIFAQKFVISYRNMHGLGLLFILLREKTRTTVVALLHGHLPLHRLSEDFYWLSSQKKKQNDALNGSL